MSENQVGFKEGEKLDDHEDVNRRAFTLQADIYANSPVITNEERLEKLAEVVGAKPGDRVLEIASGPGLVSLAIAPHCREVVGYDLTDAPLSIARENARKRGITNARFEKGSVYEIPAPDGSFDRAVCRYAFHHFEFPEKALGEMARCCARGGRVVVQDLYTSEICERSEHQDRCEIFRDPSHRHALPISELLRLFAEAGLEVDFVQTGEMPQDAEKWLNESFTTPDGFAKARKMLEQDADSDLSLMEPRRDNEGQLHFTHHIVTVSGRKL